MTVGGDPAVLVATHAGIQLFGLAADPVGRIYIGNNSNDTTGIPVQRFDPTLFLGAPIATANFGANVGDADGMAYYNGAIYVADRDEGIQKIDVATGTTTLFKAGVAINGTGSPFVIRPSDGNFFVGLGGQTGVNRIDEYDATGNFIVSHVTGTDVETMTFDPATGKIYYAAFGSEVRSLDPGTDADAHVGNSSGTIDGGLAFDPITGLLFVGTANQANPGLVETINVGTGVTTLFATGFNGSLGILRESVSGDLYFLEENALYRIANEDLPQASAPAPGTLALFGLSLVVLGLARRRR